MYITLPYSIVVAFLAVIKIGNHNEIWPKRSRMTGERKFAVSRPLDLNLIKEKLKLKKVSLNDYLTTSVTLALS
jgi:hypothetical protein